MPSSGTGTKDGWRRRLTPKPQRRRPEPPSHHERVAIPPQQAPELRQNCWQCCEALKCSHAGELLSQRQGQRRSLPQSWSAYAFRRRRRCRRRRLYRVLDHCHTRCTLPRRRLLRYWVVRRRGRGRRRPCRAGTPLPRGGFLHRRCLLRHCPCFAGDGRSHCGRRGQ